MQSEEIVRLIVLYLTGGLSTREQKMLMDWQEECAEHREMFVRLTEGRKMPERYRNYRDTDWQKALSAGERRLGMKRADRRMLFLRYAAMFLLLIGGGTFVWMFLLPVQVEETVVAKQILPGSSKAVLTLADGREVVLQEDMEEHIEIEEHVTVNLEKKQLEYTGEKEGPVEYNKLCTPRGGEYSLVLNDGTLIHLNAGSELKYPVKFDGTKREVHLKGEAWFEVAKDTVAPFYVLTDHVRIKVYGTQFNVNTSLVGREQIVLAEGKIGLTVAGRSDESILQPSELAEYQEGSLQLQIRKVNVMSYIAWKDGLFVFSDERLEDILGKLSMWYDVTFVYEKEELKDRRFTGCLKRYEDMNIILRAIQKTLSVRFTLNERTIIVTE